MRKAKKAHPNMTAIKVGDRVRYTGTNPGVPGGIQRPVGKSGVVVQIIKSRQVIETRFDDFDPAITGPVYGCAPHNVELVGGGA